MAKTGQKIDGYMCLEDRLVGEDIEGLKMKKWKARVTGQIKVAVMRLWLSHIGI